MKNKFNLFVSKVIISTLALITALILMGLFLTYVTKTIDQRSVIRQRGVAELALSEIRFDLTREQESSTYWDEAVEMTGEPGHDDWIDENLGGWMHRYYGIDEIYIIDGADAPTFAFADGIDQRPDAYAARSALIEPYVRLLRAKIAAGEVPEENSREQSLGVSDYLYVDEHPAVISVKPILSDTGKISQAPQSIFVHVVIQFLDGPFIKNIGRDYLLDDAHIRRASNDAPVAPAADMARHKSRIALVNGNGTTIGYFEWTAFKPGKEFLVSLSPLLLLLAIAIVVATFLITSLSYRQRIDQQEHEDQLRYLATHDKLTGLRNRTGYETDAGLQIDRLNAHPMPDQFAFIFLDLDRFKQVNDIYGHAAGDAVLVEYANRLTATLPRGADLYRVGGDEFAILMPGCTAQGLETLCNRILEQLAEPVEIEERKVFVGASIGVALAPLHGDDRSELNRKADVALYQAKIAGRGRFTVFGSQMDAIIQDHAALEADLRVALQSKSGLAVHYQPKFSCRTDRIEGVEALARWRHPTKGPIPPNEFIPVAEEAGLINALGLWILETACRDALDWPIDHLAINVSPAQLRDASFAASLIAILDDVGFPARRLEIEITETAFTDAANVCFANIRALGVRGIAIAIDDFGTGSSTFERLREIDFDRIKIDQSFVRNIRESKGDEEIVRAIIHMAHAKGLKTTAEGVETVAQKETLRALGCDEIQGYLMARPMSAESLEGLFTVTENRAAG